MNIRCTQCDKDWTLPEDVPITQYDCPNCGKPVLIEEADLGRETRQAPPPIPAGDSSTRSAGMSTGAIVAIVVAVLLIFVALWVFIMLAAFVAPRTLGETDVAKFNSAEMQIDTLKMALHMYKLEFGKYPTTSEGLDALVNNGKENFLDQDAVPLDPWGRPYVYICPGEGGRDFEVISLGEDGVVGGEGYAKDIGSHSF